MAIEPTGVTGNRPARWRAANAPPRGSTAAWVSGVAILLLAVSSAFAHIGVHGPPCVFRAALGIPCPGCGLTRSVVSIWQGDLVMSLRYHPLGPVVVVLLGLAALWPLLRVIPPVRKRAPAITAWLRGSSGAWVALVALLAMWLVRLVDALMGWGVFRW